MAETVNEYNETDLGNVAPNPRGDYSETKEYEYLDLVAYAGGSYICIKEDGTISGTAPTPGKTTEIWQEVSRPGDLTPEYVAMHDDVVNKAASVAEDAASVASDREQVEGMKENVASLQEQTAQDAQLTKEYRESAAGYASAAETSRMAAGESEENIRALVNGFDGHVEEKKQSAQDDITTSRQSAINAIAAHQVSSVNTVKQEGQKAINKTNADAEATAADRAAVSEMAATVDGQAAQVAQNAAQVAEDKVTAENYMQTAGESKKQALEAAERLKDSVNLVQKNTVDLQGKAPAIIGSATSYDGTPVEVNDSAEMQLQGLRLYGKSAQKSTKGINKLPYPFFDNNVVNNYGITYTQTNSHIVAVGTTTIGTNFYFLKGVDILPEGNYKVVTNGIMTGMKVIVYDDTNKTVLNNNNFTIVKGVKYGIYLNQGSSNVAVNIDMDIMVVQIDADYTEFEPYTGGLPSPSPEYPQEIKSVASETSEIGVKVTGKNLFPYNEKMTAERYIEKEINLKAGVYKIGMNLNSDGTTNDVIIGFLQSNKKFVFSELINKGIISNHEFTLNKDVAFIRFYSENTSDGSLAKNVTVNNVIIVNKNETTDYEPYKELKAIIPIQGGLLGIPVSSGGNYTDENGQQYICDEIDFSRGKYVQRVWKGVFDGSSDEEWHEYGTQPIVYITIKNIVPNAKIMCNLLRAYDHVSGYKKGITNNRNGAICVWDDRFDTVATFKSFVAVNPLIVLAILKNPIETDLTEEQIQAYKSLTTFKPTSIISNDANAQMNVEYACDTKTYIDNRLQEIAQALVASASEAE